MAADLSNLGFEVFERFTAYQAELHRKLQQTKTALEAAGIPYAVAGGHAVAAWVSSVDPSAVRTTQDVDILLSRKRLAGAISAMEAAGFTYRHVANIDMFLPGGVSNTREGVHVIFAGEKVREEYLLPAPDENEFVHSHRGFAVLNLEALVRMKLTSFRLKDQVHLQDMIGVGLVDASWAERYPEPLSQRLQKVLENPEA